MKSACEQLEFGDNKTNDKCTTESASKSLRTYIKEYEKQESLEIARLVVKSCKRLNGRYFSNQTVNKPDSYIDDQIRKAREEIQVSPLQQHNNNNDSDDIYDLLISKMHKQTKEVQSSNKHVKFGAIAGDGFSIERNICPQLSGSPSKLRSSTPYDNSEMSFSSTRGNSKHLPPDINQSAISMRNDQSVTIDTDPNVLVGGGKERDVFEHQQKRIIGDLSQLSTASSSDLVNKSTATNYSNHTSDGEDISIIMEDIERRKKRLLRRDDDSSISGTDFDEFSGTFGNLLVDLDLDETICSSVNPGEGDNTIPYNTGNISASVASHASSTSHISVAILPGDDDKQQPSHIRHFMQECLENSASENGDSETTVDEMQQTRTASVEKLKNMIFTVQEFTLSSSNNSTMNL